MSCEVEKEERKVSHLVLDAGPLIDGLQIQNLAEHFYAPEDVLKEVKDSKARRNLEVLPFHIQIREPSQEALRLATEGAKNTGDFRSLSVVDIKVIALTIDLHRENGLAVTENNTRKANEELKDEEVKDGPAILLPDGFCPEDVDSDDDEGWITEENVEEANGMNVELDENPTVACLTTDFAVQNVLLSMQLELVSIGGKRIARIQSYIQRCRACYQVCADKTREFCPKCGNRSLHKCAVSVDSNGEQRVHINWRRLAVTKGLRYSVPAPKGGKHHLPQKMFEDQQMPHLRPSRGRTEKAWDEDFAVHDVTSRAAALGFRTLANQSKSRGNVNAKGPAGKRRGGKR